jgi:PucR C-terminal helix-turn-helix domain/GGDEF-like domain
LKQGASLISSANARAQLRGRLEARRAEIEAAVLTRVQALADPAEASDPTYSEGLRATVTAAIEYGLATLEAGERRAQPLPAELGTQARLAAKSGVGLEVVLRRYFAGYALLGDFLVAEAQAAGVPAAALQRLLRSQATVFDLLIGAISKEHTAEAKRRALSTMEQRTERVRRLLAGELIDTAELAYDFEGFHLGLIAAGPGAAEAIRELLPGAGHPRLLLCRDQEVVWAWLGSDVEPDSVELEQSLSPAWPPAASLAIGELGVGLAGWRLTHRQAQAALPIAQRRSEPIVRYAEVALLASILQDETLLASLRQLYLAPLAEAPDGGTMLRETLHAYFAAERNVSSTAAALGVSRQTVRSRLHRFESRLGCPLGERAAQVELALQLEEEGGGSRQLAAQR